MKKLMVPIVAMVLLSFTTADTGLTDAERKFASNELTKTSKHLTSVIKGLSKEQLNFKSSDDSWSIAECLEHITISEYMIFGMLEGTLEVAADPSKRSEVKMKDQQVLDMMVDRSTKVKTTESFEPSGKYGTTKETIHAFRAKRSQNLYYVKTTKDDLRNHYAAMPFGTIDAFQVILFMSAHAERHILQMQEVREHEDFPTE